VDNDVQDTGSAPDSPSPDHRSRRRLIGAGVVGIAASLLPQIAARAAASTDTTPEGDEGEAPTTPAAVTTTIAPPKRPTADDESLLLFAQSLELAAVELYGIALGGDALGDSSALFVTLRDAHLAYVQSIGALLGTAPGAASEAATEPFADGFGGGVDDVLAAAYDLEATALATHEDLVGELAGTDGSALIASILIAEARHCTVLAHLAGSSDLDILLLSDAAALAPTKG
jgi:hypothetical protein